MLRGRTERRSGAPDVCRSQTKTDDKRLIARRDKESALRAEARIVIRKCRSWFMRRTGLAEVESEAGAGRR